MITYTPDGRPFSSLTEEEKLARLKESMSSLSSDERELYEAWIQDCETGGGEKVDQFFGEYRYRVSPVSMEQFLEDEFYLGNVCVGLYPKLKEDLIELFNGDYREVLMTGSQGYGKTFFVSIAVCRILYELSCLLSPQISYGMAPWTEMELVTVCKTFYLAHSKIKKAIDDKIRQCPYFQQLKVKTGVEFTKFPNNVTMSVATYNSDRILGANIFSAALDEANFAVSTKQQIVESMARVRTEALYDQAEKMYLSLIRRIKSRFMRAGGDLPGMVILASSAAMVGSFLDRRIVESKKNPDVFVRSYATWDVHPADHFSGKKFRIICGNASLRSRILAENETIDEGHLETSGARVISIPDEYRSDFESNLEDSIRDIAGISTHAIAAFFQRVEKIQFAVTARKHPFTVLEWQYGTPGEFIWDMLAESRQRVLPGGYKETYWVPKLNPKALRYVHVDTSLSRDSTGIAMGHIARSVDVIRRNDRGDRFVDRAPYFVIDFMLRVKPPYGEQIFLPDIRRLVYEIMEHGFGLIGFSSDQFQSSEMLQQMRAKGVKADNLSTEGTEAYEKLKTAFYEDRIDIYDYPILLRELRGLEINRVKQKVDHPIGGCLCADTRIVLANGTCPTIKELTNRTEPFLVQAMGFMGKMCVALARNARMTKVTDQLVDVILDNHQTVRCTPDHRFMMGDGMWRQAYQLRSGDQLMPGVSEKSISVVHVESVVGFEEVYDLSVPDFENFALAGAGIVHNSKDVSDAVAGVVVGLLKSSARLPIGLDSGSSGERQEVDDYRWVTQEKSVAPQEDEMSDSLPFLIGDEE